MKQIRIQGNTELTGTISVGGAFGKMRHTSRMGKRIYAYLPTRLPHTRCMDAWCGGQANECGANSEGS